MATEWLARLGYDYIGRDAQHGLIDYRGRLAAMHTIDAASTAAGGTAALLLGQSLRRAKQAAQ